MLNYKVELIFEDTGYDKIDTLKIMSTLVGLNGALYSIDYAGEENGSGFLVSDKSVLISIVNGTKIEPIEIIDEFKRVLERYSKIYKISFNVTESNERIEIPDGFIEHYFASSYHDIE